VSSGDFVVVFWPVIVFATALMWRPKRTRATYPALAITLNVISVSIVMFAVHRPYNQHGMRPVLALTSTAALWSGVASAALAERVRGATRFAVAIVALIGGMVGGYIWGILFVVGCVAPPECL
jgi:hypothetical protein